MKKTVTNLIVLNCIFVACLIISNVVSSKVVTILGLTVPAAIVAYPLTFLMTDVIGEIWGKEEANRTVWIGLLCQGIVLAMTVIAIALPPVDYMADMQESFVAVLGSSWRFVLGSMVAYFCSQTWDVWIFHKIRDAYIKKHGTTKGGRWLWNNGSTMTSQAIDTAIFITIAFTGVVENLPWMILSQYIIKLIYAALDTPFFYLLTRRTVDRTLLANE